MSKYDPKPRIDKSYTPSLIPFRNKLPDVNINNYTNNNKIAEMFSKLNNNNMNELLLFSLQNQIPLDTINKNGETLIDKILDLSITEKGKINLIKFLINNKVNPDKPNGLNQTPLHKACKEQYHEIVTFLLENKCNPNAVDNSGLSPLQYACFGKTIIVNPTNDIEYIGNIPKKENFSENIKIEKEITTEINKKIQGIYSSSKEESKLYQIGGNDNDMSNNNYIKIPLLQTLNNTIDHVFKKKQYEYMKRYDIDYYTEIFNNNQTTETKNNLILLKNSIKSEVNKFEQTFKLDNIEKDLVIHKKEKNSWNIDDKNEYSIIKNGLIKEQLKDDINNTINDINNIQNEINNNKKDIEPNNNDINLTSDDIIPYRIKNNILYGYYTMNINININNISFKKIINIDKKYDTNETKSFLKLIKYLLPNIDTDISKLSNDKKLVLNIFYDIFSLLKYNNNKIIDLNNLPNEKYLIYDNKTILHIIEVLTKTSIGKESGKAAGEKAEENTTNSLNNGKTIEESTKIGKLTTMIMNLSSLAAKHAGIKAGIALALLQKKLKEYNITHSSIVASAAAMPSGSPAIIASQIADIAKEIAVINSKIKVNTGEKAGGEAVQPKNIILFYALMYIGIFHDDMIYTMDSMYQIIFKGIKEDKSLWLLNLIALLDISDKIIVSNILFLVSAIRLQPDNIYEGYCSVIKPFLINNMEPKEWISLLFNNPKLDTKNIDTIHKFCDKLLNYYETMKYKPLLLTVQDTIYYLIKHYTYNKFDIDEVYDKNENNNDVKPSKLVLEQLKLPASTVPTAPILSIVPLSHLSKELNNINLNTSISNIDNIKSYDNSPSSINLLNYKLLEKNYPDITDNNVRIATIMGLKYVSENIYNKKTYDNFKYILTRNDALNPETKKKNIQSTNDNNIIFNIHIEKLIENINKISSILKELQNGKMNRLNEIYKIYYPEILKICHLIKEYNENNKYIINIYKSIADSINKINSYYYIYYFLFDDNDIIELNKFNYYELDPDINKDNDHNKYEYSLSYNSDIDSDFELYSDKDEDEEKKSADGDKIGGAKDKDTSDEEKKVKTAMNAVKEARKEVLKAKADLLKNADFLSSVKDYFKSLLYIHIKNDDNPIYYIYKQFDDIYTQYKKDNVPDSVLSNIDILTNYSIKIIIKDVITTIKDSLKDKFKELFKKDNLLEDKETFKLYMNNYISKTIYNIITDKIRYKINFVQNKYLKDVLNEEIKSPDNSNVPKLVSMTEIIKSFDELDKIDMTSIVTKDKPNTKYISIYNTNFNNNTILKDYTKLYINPDIILELLKNKSLLSINRFNPIHLLIDNKDKESIKKLITEKYINSLNKNSIIKYIDNKIKELNSIKDEEKYNELYENVNTYIIANDDNNKLVIKDLKKSFNIIYNCINNNINNISINELKEINSIDIKGNIKEDIYKCVLQNTKTYITNNIVNILESVFKNIISDNTLLPGLLEAPKPYPHMKSLANDELAPNLVKNVLELFENKEEKDNFNKTNIKELLKNYFKLLRKQCITFDDKIYNYFENDVTNYFDNFIEILIKNWYILCQNIIIHQINLLELENIKADITNIK